MFDVLICWLSPQSMRNIFIESLFWSNGATRYHPSSVNGCLTNFCCELITDETTHTFIRKPLTRNQTDAIARELAPALNLWTAAAPAGRQFAPPPDLIPRPLLSNEWSRSKKPKSSPVSGVYALSRVVIVWGHDTSIGLQKMVVGIDKLW